MRVSDVYDMLAHMPPASYHHFYELHDPAFRSEQGSGSSAHRGHKDETNACGCGRRFVSRHTGMGR
ncbi:hypothetical protein CONPUDRAFT_84126 [Coniophora puteana RWD-64-598 SS2]|uniref:Uncharacterized protein n=1 Tax=Coniophora puteana (strain RWD-64-598) TaxID=741705 RepID=A0A5M3MEU3_CONPW|nr:uncharacterized protein CONPUDRAFT_84126 [Coniophora puteana RWD-64-598 SS2]EIW77748.1 hypothetical protein CONPUDRAFT_84126 [Coniophora puteana RWD-64-598 SS2]